MQAVGLVLIALTSATAHAEDVDNLITDLFSLPTNDKAVGVKDINKPEVNSITPCECVPQHLCEKNDGFVSTDTITCPNLEVCCKPRRRNFASTFPPLIRSTPRKCGTRNPKGIISRPTTIESNESKFGEFPWMAAVLRQHALDDSYTLTTCVCGGSLIHPQVVLTAAHCVEKNDARATYKVRVGVWDSRTWNESLPPQDRHVKTVIIYPDYQKKSLARDVALVILDKPVEIRENVDVVCLPNQDMALEKSGCFVTGWGKNGLGSDAGYYNILQKLEVPIVPKNTCQNRLRATRLGRGYKLHDSFICAGGQSKKYICKGDAGSPLVCPIPGFPGRYLQTGILSMRFGCGNNGIPTVYTNVAKFSDWIDEEMLKHNFDLSAYKY